MWAAILGVLAGCLKEFLGSSGVSFTRRVTIATAASAVKHSRRGSRGSSPGAPCTNRWSSTATASKPAVSARSASVRVNSKLLVGSTNAKRGFVIGYFSLADAAEGAQGAARLGSRYQQGPAD